MTKPEFITRAFSFSRTSDFGLRHSFGIRHSSFVIWTLIISQWSLVMAMAQLPMARLMTISPPGGQIGTTLEVSISGADLDDLTELRFSDTNVSAKPKLVVETGFAEPNKFVVTIASNALPGISEVRATGRFGISNPRAFVIGQLPEVSEKSGNHTLATAMDVTVGTTINAQADANAADHFRFAAKKGQRILIECRSRAADSRMDPSMLLHDSAGRELERARNQESLDFTATEDSTNLLKVSDFLYRGGAEFFYRLTIHTSPRIDFVMPPAALPGTTNKHTIYGRNLPGGTPARNMVLKGKVVEQLEAEIIAPSAPASRALLEPAALAIRGFDYRWQISSNISEPVFIAFADAPIVVEQDGNDRPDSAQKVSLPCEYGGRLDPAGDQDWLTFDAKKGEVYWLEIFSHRLGVMTDPFFVVQRVTKNDKGEITASDLHEAYDSEANIGGQEFKTSSFDPAWRFEVKEDGTYRVQVRDLFNRARSDPRHVYRLAIRKEMPDFALVVPPQLSATKKEREAMPSAPLLRRGETVPLRVLAVRRDGYNGDIALSIEGLPSEVSYPPAKIEAGKNSALLLLTASETASNWSGTIKAVGKGKHGEAEIIRSAVGGVVIWRVDDYNIEPVDSRTTPEVTLAIAPETAPISIAITATNALEATVGTKLQIPLTIIRRGDFAEKLKLKVAGAQAVDSVKEIEIDSKTTNTTFEIDLAQAKLVPGSHTLYFQTQTKGKYVNNPEGAKQAETAAKEAETAATNAATEAKQASETAAASAKTATDAETAVKTATEKFASAKAAAEQNTADQNLAAAKGEAEKLVSEANAKLKTALEIKATAEKAAAELAAKAKSAEARKAALSARAKELTEKAKPKEITIAVYSRPFDIKVNPAPATAKK